MSRNSKVYKEIKIKACKDYQTGIGSYESISKAIGVSSTSTTTMVLCVYLPRNNSF